MSEENNNTNNSRRSALKGLLGVPFAAGVLWGAVAETQKKKKEKQALLETLDIDARRPDNDLVPGDPIRIGIIGFGIRGPQLMRALGKATKSWMDDANPAQLQAFMEQEDLNVKVTGVCDVFDPRAEEAVDSWKDEGCKRYRHYEELLASPDIDAVVIATPDHWHIPMALKAIQAGKHVYCEKPMSHNISETYAIREAVRNNPNIIFQVGHQHRQTQSFITAKDIIKKKILGHVSMVVTNTNRNSDNGAWQYNMYKDVPDSAIDWNQFLGSAPKIPFNREHFFRWRKWWAYGSGLSGDLLVHDYDRINCVLEMGMPKYAVASGGIYTHNDGREVADVLNVNLEYPDFTTGSSREPGIEKGMTFVYSATLGNQFNRPTLLMGHDATMELGNTLTVYADANSTRFKEYIESGKMDPGTPIYAYNPAAGEGTDAVTSATAKYFADKGLLWTYVNGKRVDSTNLHMKEWLNAIRSNDASLLSCDVQEGFEEAMTAHMAGLSLKIGRRIEWDHATEQIITQEGEDLDAILLSTDVGEYDNQKVLSSVM
jgi:predicted dehydrogenase